MGGLKYGTNFGICKLHVCQFSKTLPPTKFSIIGTKLLQILHKGVSHRDHRPSWDQRVPVRQVSETFATSTHDVSNCSLPMFLSVSSDIVGASYWKMRGQKREIHAVASLTEVGVTRCGNWCCHTFLPEKVMTFLVIVLKSDDLVLHTTATTPTLSALPGLVNSCKVLFL